MLINLDDATTYPRITTPAPSTVWVRTSWADPWTERPDMIPVEAEWATAPDVATATLEYRYGRVLLPGTSTPATLTPITARGYFVLIAYPCDDGGNWYWLGFAESPINSDEEPASGSLPASGIQTIPCFGMLAALQEAQILSTVHDNPVSAFAKRSAGGFVFNANHLGNKHPDEQDLSEGGVTTTAGVFALPFATTSQTWSSAAIAKHLTHFHLPTASGTTPSAGIPWTVSGLAALPDWDKPTIETDGRSVAEILDQLTPASRSLGYAIGADTTPAAIPGDPPTITSLVIAFDTSQASPLAIPTLGTVPANSRQFEITASEDPQTETKVTNDDSDVVDQVIVRGPREIGIGTFEYTSDLVDDWTVAEQADYVTGASDSDGFAQLKPSAQRKLNRQYRDAANLDHVYSRFRFKDDWDGTASGENVFPYEFAEVIHIPFVGNVEILDRLPLYSAVEYSGAVASVLEVSGSDLRDVLVTLQDPAADKPIPTHQIGNADVGTDTKHADALPFTMTVAVSNDPGPKVSLPVSGAPRHAIAGESFAGNAGDLAQKRYGGWNYTTIKATLAIRGTRRPEYRIPDDASVDALDVVRRRVLTLEHATLQSVYIAAGTVVGFDPAGDAKTSEGGHLRDPSLLIEGIATISAEYFTQPRKRVVIVTGRRISDLGIGGLITTVSTQTAAVDAVIKRIRVTTPVDRDGRQTGTPQTEIIAASDAVDPMALLADLA